MSLKDEKMKRNKLQPIKELKKEKGYSFVKVRGEDAYMTNPDSFAVCPQCNSNNFKRIKVTPEVRKKVKEFNGKTKGIRNYLCLDCGNNFAG